MKVSQMNKRYKVSRIALLFWTLFIGVEAVWGATLMFVAPDGSLLQMAEMLPYFKVLPFADILFSDFIFPGIALLVVNGITNLVAAAFLFANKKVGAKLGMYFGITLMLWINIQFVIFPFNWLSTTYFVFGLLQFVTGAFCVVGYNQSEFCFDVNDYTNIGADKSKAVVFFSRTGYTKKLAYALANEQGADIIELFTTEKTDGNLGFWWCGRFAMHRWGMALAVQTDLSGYDSVTLCFPVWDFGISSPIIEFCKQQRGKLSNVHYVSTHFMKARFEGIADKADEMLDTKRKSYRSFCMRFGNSTEIPEKRKK